MRSTFASSAAFKSDILDDNSQVVVYDIPGRGLKLDFIRIPDDGEVSIQSILLTYEAVTALRTLFDERDSYGE